MTSKVVFVFFENKNKWSMPHPKFVYVGKTWGVWRFEP
jgi:hypothetical protein